MSASEAYIRIEKIIANMKEADRNRQHAFRDMPAMVPHYTGIYVENLNESVADSEKYGLENMVSDIGGLNVVLNRMEENMYATHDAASKVVVGEIGNKEAVIAAKIASDVYHTTYDVMLSHLKKLKTRINLYGQV